MNRVPWREEVIFMATPNSSPPTQREGNKGPLVRVLQAVLKNKGFYLGTVDADFGPKTKKAVVAFQSSLRLTPDGVVGPKTWAALGASPPVGPTPVPVPVTGPVGKDQIVEVEGIHVHRSIADAVGRMIRDARAAGIHLTGWGWRSQEEQIQLRREHCGTSHYAIYDMPSSKCSPPTARPGTSQHQRGLAIDFKSMTRKSPGFAWLKANAARYGFRNLPSEPWHWSTTGK
ncbi:hypothetical protein F0U59_38750 [Archangium gephyra]|nr:hypothetical protein F0U59_38750 [Archangium gephyra]